MALDMDHFKAALDVRINIAVLQAADVALINTPCSPREELIVARADLRKALLGLCAESGG
jgi:hypothetical protein